ncbi:MAG: hypothetical protein WC860_04840 [Candidatus Margulisiibacteriota bacterium]|jgi:hypothetical protein
MDKELIELRRELKIKLRENLSTYFEQLGRFKKPLFNIQNHPKLKRKEKIKYTGLYNELLKCINNINVLNEELAIEDLTIAEEDLIFQEATANIYFASEYLKTLPSKLSDDN